MSVVVEIQKNVIEVIVEVSAVANDIAAANAKRAEDANNSAQEALQEITDLEAQITPKINEGLDDIEQARTGALNNITTAETQALEKISNGLDEIEQAKHGALTEIGTAKTGALSDIETAKTAALQVISDGLDDIEQARTGALSDIDTAKTEALDNITPLVNQTASNATAAQTAQGLAEGAATTAIQSNTDTQSLLINFFDPAIIALNSRIVADGAEVIIKLRFVQQELDLLTA
jgi:hypothetical protein